MLMKIISFLLFSSLSVLIICYIVPGASVDSIWVAVIVAIVLSIINTFVKPILVLITLPISILTLGFFYLILNIFLLFLVDWLVPGFRLDSMWAAIMFSVVISITSWLINLITGR